MAAQIGSSEPSIYNLPDVFNPDLRPPIGEVDVLKIVEAGSDFEPVFVPQYTHFYGSPKQQEDISILQTP